MVQDEISRVPRSAQSLLRSLEKPAPCRCNVVTYSRSETNASLSSVGRPEGLLPLRLRRWTGWPQGKGHGEQQRRLNIGAADGRRCGFILNDRFLFLEAGWEPVRQDIVEALEALDVEHMRVELAPVAPLPPDLRLSAWPYDQWIDIYDDGPLAATGHDLVGRYFLSTKSLDVVLARYRRPVEVLLQRMGVLEVGRQCVAFRSSSEQPSIRRVVAQRREREEAVELQMRPAVMRRVAEVLRHRVTYLAGGGEADSPDAAKVGQASFSGVQECAFPGVASLPQTLESIVTARLSLVHREAHEVPADREPLQWGAWWPFPGGRGSAGRPTMGRWRVRLDWPTGMDDWVDSLIDRHRSFFAVVAAHRAQETYPQLWEDAAAAWRHRGAPRKPLAFAATRDLDRSSIAHFLAQAIWRATTERRTWPEGRVATCPLCGEDFLPGECDEALVVVWGAARWCAPCRSAPFEQRLVDPRSGQPLATNEEGVLVAIRHASSLQPVSERGMPRTPRASDLSPAEADAWLLAKIAMPSVAATAELAPGRTWLQWLQAAGVVGDALRLSRGTAVTARDGHPCRSMFELAIDDHLSASGIAHEIEPVYPWHRTLNTSGQRRADWLLPGRVLVEAVGMDDEAYLGRLREKAELAKLSGFRLICIYPQQLDDLADIFWDHSQGALSGSAITDRLPSAVS